MPRPRITIVQLMAIVLLIGLGLAVLRKNREIARLSAQIEKMKGDHASEKDMLIAIFRDVRGQYDLPSGHVTGVDHERREVLINITRHQGAFPRLRMLLFDSADPVVPIEKPKGTIEVTQVGESFSFARVLKTNDTIESIHVGDMVYSPFWSPHSPARIALIGMMDINRDGKDDRDELKRMIQQAGGIIDFDFPPPDIGQESGRLLPRIDWYVIDDRPHPQPSFAERMGQVIKEARLDGIRPMPIGRLLAFLGYGMGQPVVSRP